LRRGLDERTAPLARQPLDSPRAENVVRRLSLREGLIVIDDALRSELHSRRGFELETSGTDDLLQSGREKALPGHASVAPFRQAETRDHDADGEHGHAGCAESNES
jgi:hypothetical protein